MTITQLTEVSVTPTINDLSESFSKTPLTNVVDSDAIKSLTKGMKSINESSEMINELAKQINLNGKHANVMSGPCRTAFSFSIRLHIGYTPLQRKMSRALVQRSYVSGTLS